jgi:Transposase
VGNARKGKIPAQLVEDEDYQLRHERVAGIDIAKAKADVCTRLPPSREGGRRASRVEEVPARAQEVMALAGRLLADGVELVVMESTSDYWRMWFSLLQAAGLRVQLVNSRHARQLAGRPKTDRLDAQWIARLAEMGLLRPSFVPPPEIGPRPAGGAPRPASGCSRHRRTRPRSARARPPVRRPGPAAAPATSPGPASPRSRPARKTRNAGRRGHGRLPGGARCARPVPQACPRPCRWAFPVPDDREPSIQQPPLQAAAAGPGRAKAQCHSRPGKGPSHARTARRSSASAGPQGPGSRGPA